MTPELPTFDNEDNSESCPSCTGPDSCKFRPMIEGLLQTEDKVSESLNLNPAATDKTVNGPEAIKQRLKADEYADDFADILAKACLVFARAQRSEHNSNDH